MDRNHLSVPSDSQALIKASDKSMTLTTSNSLEASDLSVVKCYRCYSPRVEAICHHCGRFVCKKCGLKTLGWFFTDNVFAYLQPSLDKKLKQGMHCRDCFHWDIQISSILTLINSILALIVLLAIWPGFGWLQRGLFVGGTIIIISLVRWFTDRLFPIRVKYPQELLPLYAKVKIQVQERVEANFNIDSSEYLFPAPIAEGAILVTLSVSPVDLERYESAPPPKYPLKFLAGFVALETLKNIEFVKSRGLKHSKNLLFLSKDIKLNTFETHCRQSKNFYLVEPYRIHSKALQIGPPYDKKFPLLIKSRRVKDGYRLEIILEIAVKLKLKYAKSSTEKKAEEKGLIGKPILNSLILNIPVGYQVEYTDGHFDQQERVIRWYKNSLDVKPSFSVFVEFQQVIQDGIEFRGEYSVVIDDWTISQLYVAQDLGAPNKHMVRPTNGLRLSTKGNDEKHWLAPTVEHNTKIEGKLCINTSYLSSQQVQTVSDLLEEKDTQTEEKDIQIEITDKEELLVAPTHQVVNAVIEALTEKQVFIKQVTETPGYVIETDIGSNRARYWEIRGKCYLNALQSTNLHLVISGEGPQNSRPNCEGVLTFELTLRSYIEMGDSGTPEQLKEKCKEFKGIIKIAAYQSRQIDYQGRLIFAWQLEKQDEKKFQEEYDLDKVAIILTGDNNLKKGYVFVVLSSEDEQIPKVPEHLEICLQRELPMIEIPGYEWIDKWELLRRLAIRL